MKTFTKKQSAFSFGEVADSSLPNRGRSLSQRLHAASKRAGPMACRLGKPERNLFGALDEWAANTNLAAAEDPATYADPNAHISTTGESRTPFGDEHLSVSEVDSLDVRGDNFRKQILSMSGMAAPENK